MPQLNNYKKKPNKYATLLLKFLKLSGKMSGGLLLEYLLVESSHISRSSSQKKKKKKENGVYEAQLCKIYLFPAFNWLATYWSRPASSIGYFLKTAPQKLARPKVRKNICDWTSRHAAEDINPIQIKRWQHVYFCNIKKKYFLICWTCQLSIRKIHRQIQVKDWALYFQR